MAKKIMFQGTSSNVGKSILCTALCRIFYRKGFKTVPFKAQNMALNSYVTKWGDEIGRAQVAQAEAAGIDPIVQMNPVLLKPTGNQSSQVVLMGKPVGVYSAKEYHTKYSLTALDKVKESIDFLLQQLTDIKNEVPDEDGIREIVDLWKDEESGEVNQAWMEHLEWLIGGVVSEQEV